MISINLKSSISNMALGYVCSLVSNFQIENDFNERLVLFCFFVLKITFFILLFLLMGIVAYKQMERE